MIHHEGIRAWENPLVVPFYAAFFLRSKPLGIRYPIISGIIITPANSHPPVSMTCPISGQKPVTGASHWPIASAVRKLVDAAPTPAPTAAPAGPPIKPPTPADTAATPPVFSAAHPLRMGRAQIIAFCICTNVNRGAIF